MLFNQRQRIEHRGDEVQRAECHANDVRDIAEASVEDRQHEAHALREEIHADEHGNREDPRPAHIAQPQEHHDQNDQFEHDLHELHDGCAEDWRPGRELHLLQQLTVGLQLAHREGQGAGEQVPGDDAGEQEGDVGSIAGPIARPDAQGWRLHPEDQGEHGPEDHQHGQRLQEGPAPADDAGAVAGGEVALGERPDQPPTGVKVGQHPRPPSMSASLTTPAETRPLPQLSQEAHSSVACADDHGGDPMNARSRYAATIGAAALTLTAVAGAPAAQAASGWIAAPNGLVGLPENITVYAPGAAGQVVSIGFQIGAAALTQQTTIGTNGYGALTFTPASAGTYTINGLGTAVSAGSTQIQVAAMPTYTVLLAQNNITQGLTNSLQVGVVAPIGTLQPTGTVQLQTGGNGSNIGAAVQLTGQFGSSTSTATVGYNPTQGGPVALQVAYSPASAGQLASTSPISQPTASTAIQTVALRWPANLYTGTQTVLQAVLGNNIPDGTAAFTMDGYGISGSIPTVNGVATLQWAPPASGIHTIAVAFTSGDLKYSGVSSQVVNVQGARAVDTIVVDPPTTAPWSIAAPVILQAGTSVTLVGTSKSGTPVVFSENGPCVISGVSLQALSAGICHVTAVSPGNAGLAPGSQTYTITVNAAPKKKR